jgi:hypothetical protein
MIRGESAYTADYRTLERWKDIADTYSVAVVVLHHLRKAAGEDFVDSISGTHGLAGAADTIAVLTRSRMQTTSLLKLTGRDIAETEHALEFDAVTGTWNLLDGPARLHTLADTRRQIILALGDDEMTPAQIALAAGIDRELVKKTLQRMASDHDVEPMGKGRYRCPRVPVSPVPALWGQRDSGDTYTGPDDAS